MNFHVLTLFPEMIEQGVNTSITGRAINNGLLSINAVNIRDYAFNKHNSVDDYPYGGGAGMLMQAEPVYLAYEAVKEQIDKRKQENIKSEEVTSTEPADCSEVRNSDLQDENSKKRPLRVVYLSPQEMYLTRRWQRRWLRRKTLCCFAVIMKESTNAFWKKS